MWHRSHWLVRLRHNVDRYDTAPWDRGGMTVLGSGQPADYRDDELDLVDNDDPELDLLDNLCDQDED